METLPHVQQRRAQQYDWRKLFDLWSFGISLIISSLYSTWNTGLETDFISFFFSTLLFGSAYITLLLCIGEILSGLPFNGGSFGVVRCTIGLFPGFMAGCAELIYYIIFASQSVVTFCELIADLIFFDPKYYPIAWLICYLITCGILTRPCLFWKLSNALALFCATLVLIYCFGNIPSLQNHKENQAPAFGSNVSTFNGVKFVKAFPNASWFFVGIESLALTSNEASVQRTIVAHACLSCILTLVIFSLMTIVIAFSLTDHTALASDAFPLYKGFALSLHCTYNQAFIIGLPAQFGCIYGYAFVSGKMICVLSESKLLPASLAKKTAAGCPYMAIIFGSVVGYFICFALYFSPVLYELALQFCYIAAFIMYGFFCVGYIIIKGKYAKSIAFPFQSPLGVLGAGYVVIVFVLGTISVLFFQSDMHTGLISLAVFVPLASVYYFTIAKHRQIFSEEEQQCVVTPTNKQTLTGIKYPNSRASRRIVVASRKSTLEVDPIPMQVHCIENSMNVYTIHTMLGDQTQSQELRKKAEKLYCAENVDFCQKTIEYKKKAEEVLALGFLYSNLDILHSTFLQIVEQFVSDVSPDQVNISCKQRADILKVQNFKDFSALHPLRILTIFDEATEEIEMVLSNNVH